MDAWVDRALETLGEEPATMAWVGEEDRSVLAELVRWRAFEEALDADRPDRAQEVLEVGDDAILRSFGRVYGSFGPEDVEGGCLRSCLTELSGGDRLLYELSEDGFVVHHVSDRTAFAPVTAGLVEGLAARMGVGVEVEPLVSGRRASFAVRQVVLS